jgi:hypothetical protein
MLSCKKEVSKAGFGIMGKENGLILYSDSSIQSKSYKQTLINTKNPAYLMLGSYKDPVYGDYTAGFYSQLRLVAFNPNFKDVTIDSTVLEITHDAIYGDYSPQRFHVYTLKESLLSSKDYNSSSSIPFEDDLANEYDVVPNPIGHSVYSPNYKDTIRETIRIKLKDVIGEDFKKTSMTDSSVFSSQEKFSEKYKGVYVTVDEPSIDGKGGVFTISKSPKIILYYTNNTNKTHYKFVIELNSNAIRFNTIKTKLHPTMNKEVTDRLKNAFSGDAFYAQANNIRSIIQLPKKIDTLKSVLIHAANLELPVKFDELFPPSSRISIQIFNSESDSTLTLIGFANYDKDKKMYVIDVKDHIQRLVSKQRINLGLIISPMFFSNSAERIVFCGNKDITKPILKLKYSSF